MSGGGNPVIDLTGHVYGLLTVVSRGERPKRHSHRCAFWLCRCACGVEKVISGNNLRTKNSKSCGCLRKQNGRMKDGQGNGGVV